MAKKVMVRIEGHVTDSEAATLSEAFVVFKSACVAAGLADLKADLLVQNSPS